MLQGSAAAFVLVQSGFVVQHFGPDKLTTSSTDSILWVSRQNKGPILCCESFLSVCEK